MLVKAVEATFAYPHEMGNTMLFPLLILLLFTLFIGFIGISFDNGAMDNGIAELTLLSKWLTPSINLTQESSNSSINSYEFLTAKVSNSRNVFHLVCASVRNPSQKHDPMQKNHIIWPQQSVNQQSTCVTLKGRGNMYSSLKLPS